MNGLIVLILAVSAHTQLCTNSDSKSHSIFTEEFSYSEYDQTFYINNALVGGISNDLYLFIRARNSTDRYALMMRTDLDLNTVWI